MAALNFPANPSNGDEFEGYVYDSTLGVWNRKPSTVAYTVSPNAPTNPNDGDVWFNEQDGSSYIYYVDTDSEQWIEIGGKVGATGAAGQNGADGADGRFTNSATKPTSSVDGDVWFNTNNGKIFVYYNDGNTSQWVESPAPIFGYDTLANLSDTSISSPSDGQILSYDSSSSKWVGQTLNVDKALNELTDVTITSPTNNQVLSYASGSSQWQNISITNQTAVQALIDRDDKAYCQVNKIDGQSFTTGHQNILLDDIEKAKNITLASNQLTFALPGIYSINVGFRWGSGTDTWSGVNLYNATAGIVGRSFGTGQLNSSDAGPAMFNFMADVQDTSVAYYLRLYRAGGTLAIVTPDTEAGKAIVATIVKVS